MNNTERGWLNYLLYTTGFQPTLKDDVPPTEYNVTLFLSGLDIQKIQQQPLKIHKAHISESIQSMVIYITDLQFIDAQDITLNAKYFCFAK